MKELEKKYHLESGSTIVKIGQTNINNEVDVWFDNQNLFNVRQHRCVDVWDLIFLSDKRSFISQTEMDENGNWEETWVIFDHYLLTIKR